MKSIRTITLNPAFDLHYNMEHFEAKKENYVQSILCDAGGKGINTSRALTVNGQKNTAYVILGKENGASFEAQLEQYGLCYAPLYVEGRIRENITLHPADDKETRISLDTFRIQKKDLDAMEALLAESSLEESLLSFSGRLPKGIEKEDAIAFLGRLIASGARIVVDSNSFTPDDLCKIHPWFIKPNEQEIVSFLGRGVNSPKEAAEAAKALVKMGVSQEVMLSLGGDGAVWSNGERMLILSVPRLEHPVSTIGAGDSTIAGYLAAMAQDYEIEKALSLAVAYGTAACMTEGTLPPRPEDVAKVLAKVTVTELN